MSYPKPIIYLDVDDVLLRFPPFYPKEWWALHNRRGEPALFVKECLEWMTENFHVRWLTSWAPYGEMRPELIKDLSELLHVEESLLNKIHNPKSWVENKIDGIDFDTKLMWFWLDDELSYHDTNVLSENHCLELFIHTNSSVDPTALYKSCEIIAHKSGVIFLEKYTYPLAEKLIEEGYTDII